MRWGLAFLICFAVCATGICATHLVVDAVAVYLPQDPCRGAALRVMLGQGWGAVVGNLGVCAGITALLWGRP